MNSFSEPAAASGSLAALPPLDERRRLIAERLQGATAGLFVPFESGYRELPVVRIRSETLAYRLDNGRIFFELEHALDAAGIPRAQAEAGQDSPAIQELLHRLLVAKAEDPRGPILRELARHGQQTEPLLVTASGVVLNGNRRLAAMRELRRRDPAAYASFAEVAAAVLPADLTNAAAELIEAALQMAPETKLAYSWVNRRLKLRTQRDRLGIDPATIRNAYRLADAAQLGREIGELELAEAYLDHFGERGRYESIEDAGPLFEGMGAQLAGLNDLLRRLWTAAGFCLIRARGQFRADLKETFPFSAPDPERLVVDAMKAFAVDRGILAEADADAAPLGRVADALEARLRETRDWAATAEGLMAAVETVRSEERDRNAPHRLMKRVREARRLLDRLEPASLSLEDRRRLRADLAAMQEQAAFLFGAEAEPAPVRGWRALGRSLRAGRARRRRGEA